MSSIILPSSTVSHLQRPIKSGAYPFKAKRFGRGEYAKGYKPIREADPSTHSPYKNEIPIRGADPRTHSPYKNETTGGSATYDPTWQKNQEFLHRMHPEVGQDFHSRPKTGQTGSGESGSGYFGPTGWVNTQPIQAQAEYTPEQARLVGRYHSTGNRLTQPRRPTAIKSQADQINAIKKMIYRDKGRNKYRKSASHIQRLLAKLLGATQ